jgi:hypothetical protein
MLPVLLHLQGLRRDAQTLAGRLLRVLFLWHGGVSAGADGAALRVSGEKSSNLEDHSDMDATTLGRIPVPRMPSMLFLERA